MQTHGLSQHPLYRAWHKMKQRCANPENPSFHNYGGRGIRVCDRWQSFENFLADMGERPDGKTLDREDNDGDYHPENCRWATRTEQNNNKRRQKNARLFTYDGVTLTLREWSERVGIPYHTLYYRLSHGWAVDRAFTTPVEAR